MASKKPKLEVVEGKAEAKDTRTYHKLPDSAASMLNHAVKEVQKLEAEGPKMAESLSDAAKEILKGTDPKVLEEVANFLINSAQLQKRKEEVGAYAKQFIASYCITVADIDVATVSGYDLDSNSLILVEKVGQ